ncbi:hypothetical protein KKY53_11035 [Pseudomonas aeruginosa]|nr:hypothetical protein [Pseudomonas aeruginosa]WCV81052.1 hypothetical protein KKY53_11035 [Pseudomonas aeruginosa]HBO0859776.1 hypothetical protein [Pseudomonas aeruginosa]HCE6879328.1 hypothetical protein [Pseudomonas aeruginosa]HDR2971915.1 hypothetical protein [Pseudomonas aeruginosa]
METHHNQRRNVLKNLNEVPDSSPPALLEPVLVNRAHVTGGHHHAG